MDKGVRQLKLERMRAALDVCVELVGDTMHFDAVGKNKYIKEFGLVCIFILVVAIWTRLGKTNLKSRRFERFSCRFATWNYIFANLLSITHICALPAGWREDICELATLGRGASYPIFCFRWTWVRTAWMMWLTWVPRPMVRAIKDTCKLWLEARSGIFVRCKLFGAWKPCTTFCKRSTGSRINAEVIRMVFPMNWEKNEGSAAESTDTAETLD